VHLAHGTKVSLFVGVRLAPGQCVHFWDKSIALRGCASGARAVRSFLELRSDFDKYSTITKNPEIGFAVMDFLFNASNI